MINNENLLINFINKQISTIPANLNSQITRKNKKFKLREEYYEIKRNIDDFLEGEDNNRYIILPGLRGVGKTTIIYQIYEYLLKEKNIKQNQILYLSCDKLNEHFGFKILDVIECFLKEHHNCTLRSLDKEVFLFIDESQYDYNWALSGKIIYDESKKVFMIFTGSSALNLEYNADSARRLLKRNINPLSYSNYLKLKYNFESNPISNGLLNLLTTGKTDKAIPMEKELKPKLYNISGYSDNDWEDFLYYGGFPSSLYEKYPENISEKLVEIIRKVVMTDMNSIDRISNESQINSMRLLNYLALQQPGEISQNKIANYLDSNAVTIKNILDILEKTHLIFHCQPYGSPSKRNKKPWKYYFATSSLRHALNMDIGNIMQDRTAYKGILLENFVASNFFNNKNIKFNIFYDSNKKRNVDFIIQQGFNKPIPVEVGIGKKDKKQISYAIKKYNANYGIIISTTTTSIKKEENIIYLPPKTFSFL